MGDIQDLLGGQEFDSSQYQAKDYDVLPPGEYPAEIERAEVRATKAKNGHYIWLQFSVLGERHTNRKLFANLNIDNPSQKAVEIGLGELAAIGKALNGGQDVKITSTDQLQGQHLLLKVGVKNDDNVIRAYRPLGAPQSCPPLATAGTGVQQAPPQHTVAAATSAIGNNVPPWKR